MIFAGPNFDTNTIELGQNFKAVPNEAVSHIMSTLAMNYRRQRRPIWCCSGFPLPLPRFLRGNGVKPYHSHTIYFCFQRVRFQTIKSQN